MNPDTQSFLYLIRSFIAGITLIRQPGLRRFVIIPLLINTALFSLAAWLLWSYLSTALDALLPSWLAWLAWLVLPLFLLSILSIVFYSFTLLANIIAAPFYGKLAQAVEAHLKGGPIAEATSGSFFKDAPKMLASEVRRLSYYLLRAVPLLLLTLIPGVNMISLPLWLMFSAWFLSFEYSAYGLDNHHVLFQQQKQILNRTKLSTMSFGGISLLATTIPVVNLFAPAIAVAAATKILFERGELG
ncbi:cysteine biosynthesis protein CysZ [Cycloclasticus sp. 46_120_T64]|nr:cysteine biosynthesis protein CysZ [Cycloclasticus sp. 46_120_T64]